MIDFWKPAARDSQKETDASQNNYSLRAPGIKNAGAGVSGRVPTRANRERTRAQYY
jgi:hypothetical protein